VKVLWTPRAWEDYLSWTEANQEIARKIHLLIRDIRRDPFGGLGKPEPLKANLQGWWARRITKEHRFVYRIARKGDDRHVEIAQCRTHYGR